MPGAIDGPDQAEEEAERRPDENNKGDHPDLASRGLKIVNCFPNKFLLAVPDGQEAHDGIDHLL